MAPRVNPLLSGLDAPPIPEARGWARAYDGRVGGLVDLSQAAPGAPPPPELRARLAAAAGSVEAARYGDIQGDAELRMALATQTSALYGGRIDPSDIAITAGCNQAFFVAMLAVAQAGDAVLLPTPWYFNHQTTCELLGIEPRALPCDADAGFVPDPARAEALIDGRTRAIALVTPNNPTGAIYPPETIRAFVELCRRRGLWLILDETYADFLPRRDQRPHDLFADGSWRDVVIRLYSFSKAYAVPGHRVGAMIADRAVTGQVAKILDNMQICAPRAAQIALAWAIGALATA